MKKARLRIDRIIITLIIFILLIFLTYFIVNKPKTTEEKFKEYERYVASDAFGVKLYDMNYSEINIIRRGQKVTILEDKIDNLGTYYSKIKYDNTEYLILEEDLVEDINDAVKEKEIYVRTPVTIYKNAIDSDIASFAKKGSKLEIIGFDELNEDGTVDMYKIKYDDIEGYVYSKYLVSTYEEATKNNEQYYDYHKERTKYWYYDLYGGSAANLDYYPYWKPSFENNVIPNEANTLYLNSWPSTFNNIDKYIELAKNNNINAFVVDIKDGALGYESDVAKEYSQTSFESSQNTKEEYKNVIKKLKDEGFYVIGRIVTFNDELFAVDNPNDCIKDTSGKATKWVSAYSRRAWEYNVKLAIESVELFEFNEIQFDYVRFPEASYSWSKNGYDFRNNYKEEKGQTIQNFLFYAADQIHEHGAYISADVFGESTSTYVAAYGHYWPAISNVVDVISAMPYPDLFAKGYAGFEIPWEHPYEVVKKWSESAVERQKEIPTPAKVRTWIQAYNATPSPRIVYDSAKIEAQIKGLYDAGLGGGFITWNSASSLEKYTSIAPAFRKEY